VEHPLQYRCRQVTAIGKLLDESRAVTIGVIENKVASSRWTASNVNDSLAVDREERTGIDTGSCKHFTHPKRRGANNEEPTLYATNSREATTCIRPARFRVKRGNTICVARKKTTTTYSHCRQTYPTMVRLITVAVNATAMVTFASVHQGSLSSREADSKGGCFSDLGPTAIDKEHQADAR